MTKAAYSAHLRSSPHLDCNETYLSHPLISHLLQLLSGNLTVSVQSCLTFDRKPNGSGPSGGRLENHSLCDDALDRRGGRRDRRKTEVKYQFSSLKWSMKLYFAGARLRIPAKVPLLEHIPVTRDPGTKPFPSPHTQKTIRATSAFWERHGRNSETPHL